MHSIRDQARRFAAVLVLGIGAAIAAGAAGAQALEEGKQYVRLRNPVPVDTGKKIEVIEFFSYGCPHCATFEPEVQGWLKSKPADVEFRRIPVLFNPSWIVLAKAYYTVEGLGEEARLTTELFKAIHDQKVNLTSEKTFFEWLASKGIDRKKAEEMYGSFAIAGKINKAKSQAQAYQIQSVPTVVVDGKFITAPDKVGSFAAMAAAINSLVAKARAERPKS
jgi:protein dithiol oxidoreductase (disulfide-forming)